MKALPSLRGGPKGRGRNLAFKTLLARRPDSHKGDYGHVLVIGGSVGFAGAPMLSALAALRSGAGLVSLAVPEEIYFVVASQMLEVMVHPLPATEQGTLGPGSLAALQPLLAKADVVAFGPGLSQQPAAQKFAQKLIASTDLPIVLDADGINAFAGRSRTLLRKARGPLVITPHPGEMARLLGFSVDAIQRNRVKVAMETAKQLRVTVVLKGHRTVVASATGATYTNTTGNPGMASAGVGDVLTGVIAALIGQGLSSFQAATAGVYWHGLAGDLATRRLGQISMIASDLLAALPDAFGLSNRQPL